MFDDAFARLGLDVRTSNRYSWENYQSYIAAIDLVRQRLRGKGFTTARLVDAHSFCWMLVRLHAAQDQSAASRRIAMSEERTVVAAPPRDQTTSNGESIVDFIALNERRAYLGNLAEEIALEAEQERLRFRGRPDLAGNERIVSTNHRLGYDIASFKADGSPRPVEVKAAIESGGTLEFYVSENEREKSTELPNSWLYLVLQAESTHPKIKSSDLPFSLRNSHSVDSRADPATLRGVSQRDEMKETQTESSGFGRRQAAELAGRLSVSP